MKNPNILQIKQWSLLLIVLIFCASCHEDSVEQLKVASQEEVQAKKADFVATMQKHLDAVTNRDLATLKSTLLPTGKMQLILPSTEIIDSVSGFLDYHEAWFQDTMWSFETKILNTDIGEQFGIAIVEIVYSEPERDGKPYFNRMNVSYALEHNDGKWFIIKDHASSVEKSTD